MEVRFVIPSRVGGKGRPQSTVIRSNVERDKARVAAWDVLDQTLSVRDIFDRVWQSGWKAACDIGFISTYTPKETREEEAHVRAYAKAAMQGRAPLDGPVWFQMTVQQIPPPSWSKTKRETTRYITTKPDGDNQLKLVLDALNSVCWTDDSRIAAFAVIRLYDTAGPDQVSIRFGTLDAEKMPVPEWAPKVLPLFEGLAI
jgi:Holliday junction resolvase RusA-like endonuclease